MNTLSIQFRTQLKDPDIKDLPRLTSSTGFFNQEEVDIVEELVVETLTKPDCGYLWQVAEQGEEPAGFTCFGRIPGSMHAWDLYWIVVGRVFQGNGLGRKLISITEEYVRNQGGKLLIAETSGRPLYLPTRNFYLHCGYQSEVTIAEFYGPGDDKVFFIKRF